MGQTGKAGRAAARSPEVRAALPGRAALILPHEAVHTAAEEFRYDIERLTDRFGLGCVTVCDRLSALRRHLWTARAVTRHRGGWGEPGKTFAIGLGCEIRHAHRLVHSDRLDLGNATAATPIGRGWRVCERLDFPQRAAPPLGRPLLIDQNTSTFVPYPVADPSA